MAVALAMLTVSLPASATHNSVGHNVDIVQADEVEIGENNPEAGTLRPDVAPGGPYDVDYHENLENETPPLPARNAPDDQTGLRYNGASCQAWSEFEGSTDAVSDYKSALQDGDGCYIGFLDQQLEYVLHSTFLLIEGDDLLYPANPEPSDDHCNGRSDTADRGAGEVRVPRTNRTVNGTIPILVGEESAVDEAITRGDRATSDRCDGSGEDTSFIPGSIDVDADLIEQPASAAHEAGGTAPGSGTWTVGQIGDTYTYIFGQPHPDTDPANRTGFVAGEGPFGPNPAELGSPIADITGACGDRTRDCALLSPQDIINYDDNFPRTPDAPRVCHYPVQYIFSAGEDVDRGADKCGNWGERADGYLGVNTAGGFGADDVPTWVNTLPGWTWGVIFLQLQSYEGYVNLGFAEDDQGMVDDYFDDERGFREGFIFYTAVNPVVATAQSSLRCVTPNILAEGDDSVLPDGFSDPGVYGTYQADAIDADVYPVAFRSQFASVRDATHDPVRNGSGPIPGLAEAQEATGVEMASDVVDPLTEADVDDTVALAEDGIDDTLPGEADPTEERDPEPHAQYHGSDYEDTDGDGVRDATVDTTNNQAPFADLRKEGLSCNAAGDLEFNQDPVFQGGGMQFDVHLQQQSLGDDLDAGLDLDAEPNVTLKDPTLGVVAEEDSDAGAWQPGTYTFAGDAHAVLDTNNNSRFDHCAGANLEPERNPFEPAEDVCPWEALWDAYNSNCDNNAQVTCDKLLDQRGYDRSQGVGLVFNLTVTGPIVLFSEATTERQRVTERIFVGGTEDTTTQNCVIGTSTGFAPHLATLVGTETGDADDSFDDEDAKVFCPDEAVEAGADRFALVEDAFDDQSATQPGAFSAEVQWAKLLPTPAIFQDAFGFGDDDKLCTTGVWSVSDLDDDGTVNNTTATGHENGIADDTEEDPGSPGQENIVLRHDQTTPADLSATVFDDSLNGLHTFSDCEHFDTTGQPQE